MPVERSNRRIAEQRIRDVTEQLLDASRLCAISTVTPRGAAHVNTAYFAWTSGYELVWLSDPEAQHSRNLSSNDGVAIAVFDSRQTWGKPDRGIQLFGTAREGDDDRAADAYAARFREYTDAPLDAYRLYVFRPRRIKVFDEPAFGAGTFVTANVSRSGRVAWQRTDVYRSRKGRR